MSVIARSRMILLSAVSGEDDSCGETDPEVLNMISQVMPRMRHDNVFMTHSNDHLICLYGGIMFHHLGHRRVHDVSKRMQQVGKLLQVLRNHQPGSCQTMWDAVHPENYDKVIRCIENLCGRKIPLIQEQWTFKMRLTWL